MKTITLNPIRHRVFTAGQFIKEFDTIKPADVEKITIIPAKLGEKGFGKIEIKFNKTQFFE